MTTEISVAAYFVKAHGRHEIIAWAELREPGGRRRIEIGSYPSVALARAACERDAVARCRREDAQERAPMGVAIRARNGAPIGNRNASKHKAADARALRSAHAIGKGLPPAQPAPGSDRGAGADPGAALDVALAAFAEVVGDEG